MRSISLITAEHASLHGLGRPAHSHNKFCDSQYGYKQLLGSSNCTVVAADAMARELQRIRTCRRMGGANLQDCLGG